MIAGLLLALGVSCGERSPAGEPSTSGEREKDIPQKSAVQEAAAEPAAPAEPAAKADLPPAGARVVLIVVDTLRADRLGCYGYREQPTTPTMDRLAEEGILFEKFHAASPWTGASFGSILTGVSPTVHGAGERERKGSKSGHSAMGLRVSVLNKAIPTLGEMLGDITSAAVVTNAFLHPAFGFARGFNEYDHENAGLDKARRADATTKQAIAMLETHRDQPLFLMVHYFDPHMSYDPPAKYRDQFAPGRVGRIAAPFIDHVRARSGELDPTAAEQTHIRGLYHGEVRFVDDQIAVLLEAMERLGMLDDTWIAVTADHGEEQFDHGSFDHGHRYEEEVTRVPLIVRAPGGKWRAETRITQSARHIDLTPTILAWFGVEPPQHIDGQSLLPLMTGDETKHRPAYMEFNIYRMARCSLFDGRYKVVRAVEHPHGWLYDLDDDPGERKKLGKEHREYGRLMGQLRAVRERLALARRAVASSQGTIELPPEVESSLRALGYITDSPD